MTIFKSNTAIFFNPDCNKYGVCQIVKAYVLDGKQLYKWHQVAIENKTYTPYKAVARRWADKIRDKGILEVRADMAQGNLLLQPMEVI